MNEQQQKYTELQAHKIESIKDKYKVSDERLDIIETNQPEKGSLSIVILRECLQRSRAVLTICQRGYSH